MLPNAVSVIPNGIDAAMEAGAAAPAPRAALGGTVLFVGRLRTRKAVAVLLEAWPVVAGELPEARLVVMLRDPVARAHSHWKLNRRIGLEELSFEEALDVAPAASPPSS